MYEQLITHGLFVLAMINLMDKCPNFMSTHPCVSRHLQQGEGHRRGPSPGIVKSRKAPLTTRGPTFRIIVTRHSSAVSIIVGLIPAQHPSSSRVTVSAAQHRPAQTRPLRTIHAMENRIQIYMCSYEKNKCLSHRYEEIVMATLQFCHVHTNNDAN